jgi:hypothetical protein
MPWGLLWGRLSGGWTRRRAGPRAAAAYFRAPRCGFFRLVWRRFALVRLGLLMVNVPLPRYSAL